MALVYSTSTALAITAGSLASAANRSSAAVTTGSDNIAQIMLTVNVQTTSTAPSGGKQIIVYGYDSENGMNYSGNSGTTDNTDGTNKALTAIGSPSGLTLLGVIPLNQGANAVIATGVFEVTRAFGCIPRKWGIVLYNDAGTALGAAVSAYYTEVSYS